ncbi:MAG: hypothetical protein AMXMBFR64_33240 [Myxococcales bacterium]
MRAVQERLMELAEDLAPSVGAAVLAAAARLALDGAVQTVTTERFRLVGVVAAQNRRVYRCSVGLRPGLALAAACDCGAAPCAHAAATLLLWEALGRDIVRDGGTVALGPRRAAGATLNGEFLGRWAAVVAAAPPTPPLPGTSQAATGAWARWAGVSEEAERSVRHIASELGLAGSAHWFAAYDSRTVIEIIALPNATTRDLKEVQAAVCKWLVARPTMRRAVEDAERERLARLARPADPVGARIYDALEAERARLRALLPPLPSAPAGRLTIELDPPRLSYESSRERGCAGHPGGRAYFTFGEAGAFPVLQCGCQSQERKCQVLLGAVESALILAGGPDNPDLAVKFFAAVGAPVWERTLAALDRCLDAKAPAVAEGRMAFIVDDSGVQPRVRPALASPAKKGGGYKVSRVGRTELGGVELTPAEAHALDLVLPRGAAGPFDCGLGATLHAVDLLVGHPMIFRHKGKAPVPLVREDASLVTERDGEAIRILVRLGDTVVTPREAWEPLSRADSGRALWLPEGGDRVVLLRVPPVLVRLVRELATRPHELPPEAAAPLIERLPRLAERVGVQVDPSLRGREVPASTTPHVRLALAADGRLDVQVRVRPLPDALPVMPGIGYPEVFVHRDDGTVCGVRDLALEGAAARALAARLELPEEAAVAPHSWSLPPSELALEVVAAAQELDTEVLWADERRPVVADATAAQLKVTVGSGATWFSLGGSLQTTAGVVPLSELLAAVRDEHRFVRVGDRAWVRIGDALRQQLEGAAALADDLRLPTLAAPLVDALREDGAQVDADGSWLALVEAMRTASTEEPAISPDLRATLRPYQEAGVRWILRLSRWAKGACLADDMGLGKTVQALAVLLDRAALGPALVVAPTSVGFNWAREAATFAPTLRVSAFRGRDSLDVIEHAEAGDVIVTSYDLLARYDEILHALPFATVVLDEAQAIKNPATQRARAAYGLDTAFVLALTGTPLENHTGELWSLFRAVAPGLLGSQETFQRRFAVPIERYKSARARRSLAHLARPFVLRRMKAEVAPELPPRTDVRVDVELSAAERRLYDTLRASALAALAGDDPGTPVEKRRFQILAALTRLRQLACHPRLVDPNTRATSSKLQVLRETVAELREGGHKALVFSQFTSLLALVREALEQDGARLRYLDGATPALQRRAEVDAFQRGEADVFLLSLKAGGTGLNLTAADYVIHLDPWWNPAVEDQATDRAHRIGQDRPVTVIRLVATGTVEEGILALHADKRELVDAVLEGTGAAASLSLDEMMRLLVSGSSGDVDEEEEVAPTVFSSALTPAPL